MESNVKKNFKKGFTLAEILVVLVLIGVISAITIPSVVGNANTKQKIAQFKKAYNSISSAYAAGFATSAPPVSSDTGSSTIQYDRLKKAFSENLNIKAYCASDKASNNTCTANNYTYEPPALGGWYIMEDGTAFRIQANTANKSCITKMDTNNQTSTSDAIKLSCFYITIDIDGPDPNKGDNSLVSDSVDTTKTFSGDRIVVYVTNNSIASGNPDKTAGGRILSSN